MMKTAFRTPDNRFVVRESCLRATGSDELRIKVEASGICGTDLHDSKRDKDVPFGHEIAGVVLEAGSSVTGFSTGDKVVLDSSTPCGFCDNCRNKRQELCAELKSFFRIQSFGMAEEMLAPAITAIKYSGLTPEVACLHEPLGVAIDVYKLADISFDSNVLIVGLGPIGLMAMSLARHAGVRRLFASDFRSRDGRYGLAEKIGFDGWIDPSEIPLEDYAFKTGIDRIIVTAPPMALSSTFKVASTGTIISFIGIGGGDKGMCTFDADAFHFKKLQLRASYASPALYGPLALQYLKEGVVDGESMISHRFKLDDIALAMETAKSPNALKVVVNP